LKEKSLTGYEEKRTARQDKERRQSDSVRERIVQISILNSHGLFDEDNVSNTKSSLVGDMARCALSVSAASVAVVPLSVEVFLMLNLVTFLLTGQRFMGEEL